MTRAELEADIVRRLDELDEPEVRIDDATITRLMAGDPQPFCNDHAIRLAYDEDTNEWLFRACKPQLLRTRRMTS